MTTARATARVTARTTAPGVGGARGARGRLAAGLTLVALAGTAACGAGSDDAAVGPEPTSTAPNIALDAARPAVGATLPRPWPTKPRVAAVPLPGVRVRCPAPASLTTWQLLMQTLMIGVDGRSVAQATRLGSGSAPVGGLFLSGTSTTVLRDGVLRRLGAGTQPPLVAVDEEGGRVQRIDALAGSIASPQRQAALSDASLQALARRRAQQLRSYGVTLDLAPVADLHGPATVIGDRSYGTTPGAVVTKAGAFAAGLRGGGVLPTLKHFPGHGQARGDSHRGTATTPPLASLQAADLRVYPGLLDDGPALVMVGHLVVPGLSTSWRGEALPTSLDPATYRLLRGQFAFDGLVVTDELGMLAVSRRFDRHEAVRRALAAGADLALVNVTGTGTRDVSVLLAQLVDDVHAGRLPIARVREAAARVMAVKGCA